MAALERRVLQHTTVVLETVITRSHASHLYISIRECGDLQYRNMGVL